MMRVESLLPEDTSFRLEYRSEHGEGAELWFATLIALEWDEAAESARDGATLAEAHIVRASLCEDGWFDDFDAESEAVAQAAAPFADGELEAQIDALDEEGMLATGLLVLDYVEVPEESRGARLSHALVRAVAAVFRDDRIALIPACRTDGVYDAAKEIGLVRHWGRAGFVQIPGSRAMLLARSSQAHE